MSSRNRLQKALKGSLVEIPTKFQAEQKVPWVRLPSKRTNSDRDDSSKWDAHNINQKPNGEGRGEPLEFVVELSLHS